MPISTDFIKFILSHRQILLALFCCLLLSGCIFSRPLSHFTGRSPEEKTTPPFPAPHDIVGESTFPAHSPAEISTKDATLPSAPEEDLPEIPIEIQEKIARRTHPDDDSVNTTQTKSLQESPTSFFFLGQKGEAFINQRINVYADKMANWNAAAAKIQTLDIGSGWPEGWHDCVQNIEMILFQYKRLKTDTLPPPPQGQTPPPLPLALNNPRPHIHREWLR